MKFDELLEQIEDDSDPEFLYKYFRGISLNELNEIIATKRVLPSSDLIPFDNEVLEYAIGEDYGDMSQEDIDDWIMGVVWWYDGSLKSVKGGVNLTTDFDNAKGYGDYVIAVVIENGEVADVSDSHSFAKNANDVKVSAIYDVQNEKWLDKEDIARIKKQSLTD
jgi:hypothetical protein